MFKKLYKFINTKNNQINKLDGIISTFEDDLKSPKLMLGQIHTKLIKQQGLVDNIQDVEFQAFSQYGDDGIIQYLVNNIDFPHKTFIEFGVENYKEANTRFLLINNDWAGYIIDGSSDNVEYIKKDRISWACELHAEAAFITVANINDLLQKPGFDPEVGILSIDIDGNDYWIWEKINSIHPVVVIVEYNSVFGKNTSWTIPYSPDFIRENKLYFGASLKALCDLAEKKGYAFIGSNSKGLNAYFVRKDKLGALKTKTIDEGYVESRFREYSNNGIRISGRDRIVQLKGLDIFDLDKRSVTRIDPSVVKY